MNPDNPSNLSCIKFNKVTVEFPEACLQEFKKEADEFKARWKQDLAATDILKRGMMLLIEEIKHKQEFGNALSDRDERALRGAARHVERCGERLNDIWLAARMYGITEEEVRTECDIYRMN